MVLSLSVNPSIVVKIKSYKHVGRRGGKEAFMCSELRVSVVCEA